MPCWAAASTSSVIRPRPSSRLNSEWTWRWVKSFGATVIGRSMVARPGPTRSGAGRRPVRAGDAILRRHLRLPFPVISPPSRDLEEPNHDHRADRRPPDRGPGPHPRARARRRPRPGRPHRPVRVGGPHPDARAERGRAPLPVAARRGAAGAAGGALARPTRPGSCGRSAGPRRPSCSRRWTPTTPPTSSSACPRTRPARSWSGCGRRRPPSCATCSRYSARDRRRDHDARRSSRSPRTPRRRQAITAIRQLVDEAETVNYIYVIGPDRTLLGVLSLYRLLLSPGETPVRELMAPSTVRVQVDADREVAARLLTDRNLLALPVVDDADHLLGIITEDDVADVLEAEATEDIERLGGSEPLNAPYRSSGRAAARPQARRLAAAALRRRGVHRHGAPRLPGRADPGGRPQLLHPAADRHGREHGQPDRDADRPRDGARRGLAARHRLDRVQGDARRPGHRRGHGASSPSGGRGCSGSGRTSAASSR